MNRKKRDKKLIFKVNEDEWNIIQKRLEKCNVSNMSDLFRQMMLYGIYLEYVSLWAFYAFTGANISLL